MWDVSVRDREWLNVIGAALLDRDGTTVHAAFRQYDLGLPQDPKVFLLWTFVRAQRLPDILDLHDWLLRAGLLESVGGSEVVGRLVEEAATETTALEFLSRSIP